MMRQAVAGGTSSGDVDDDDRQDDESDQPISAGTASTSSASSTDDNEDDLNDATSSPAADTDESDGERESDDTAATATSSWPASMTSTSSSESDSDNAPEPDSQAPKNLRFAGKQSFASAYANDGEMRQDSEGEYYQPLRGVGKFESAQQELWALDESEQITITDDGVEKRIVAFDESGRAWVRGNGGLVEPISNFRADPDDPVMTDIDGWTDDGQPILGRSGWKSLGASSFGYDGPERVSTVAQSETPAQPAAPSAEPPRQNTGGGTVDYAATMAAGRLVTTDDSERNAQNMSRLQDDDEPPAVPETPTQSSGFFEQDTQLDGLLGTVEQAEADAYDQQVREYKDDVRDYYAWHGEHGLDRRGVFYEQDTDETMGHTSDDVLRGVREEREREHKLAQDAYDRYQEERDDPTLQAESEAALWSYSRSINDRERMAEEERQNPALAELADVPSQGLGPARLQTYYREVERMAEEERQNPALAELADVPSQGLRPALMQTELRHGEAQAEQERQAEQQRSSAFSLHEEYPFYDQTPATHETRAHALLASDSATELRQRLHRERTFLSPEEQAILAERAQHRAGQRAHTQEMERQWAEFVKEGNEAFLEREAREARAKEDMRALGLDDSATITDAWGDTTKEILSFGQTLTPTYDSHRVLANFEEDTGVRAADAPDAAREYYGAVQEAQPGVMDLAKMQAAAVTPGVSAYQNLREGNYGAAAFDAGLDVATTFWIPGKLGKMARAGASAGDLGRATVAGVYGIPLDKKSVFPNPQDALDAWKREASVGVKLANPANDAVPMASMSENFRVRHVPHSEFKESGYAPGTYKADKLRTADIRDSMAEEMFATGEEVRRTLPYDPLDSGSVTIYDPDTEKVAMVKYNYGSQKGQWASPGGLVDAGETASEAAIREAFEETTAGQPGTGIEGRVIGQVTDDRVQNHQSFIVARESGSMPRGGAGSHGELQDRQWFSIDEARNLDLAYPDAEQKALDALTQYRQTGNMPEPEVITDPVPPDRTLVHHAPRSGLKGVSFHTSAGTWFDEDDVLIGGSQSQGRPGIFNDPAAPRERFFLSSSKGDVPFTHQYGSGHILSHGETQSTGSGLTYKRGDELELIADAGQVISGERVLDIPLTDPVALKKKTLEAEIESSAIGLTDVSPFTPISTSATTHSNFPLTPVSTSSPATESAFPIAPATTCAATHQNWQRRDSHAVGC